MDRTQTRYNRSDSEQLEVNAKLFAVIRKRNISVKEKVKKIGKLLGKKPKPDINAQDGNDNWNTALHLAVERNELEVVNFLLNQGADTTVENGERKTPLQLAEECNNVEIIDALKSCTSQVELPLLATDRLASHTSQPVAANPNQVSVSNSNSHAALTDKQTASTFLLPFSGKLPVDTELKLSNEYFKRSIEKFHETKVLLAIDELKTTPKYPTTYVLAQFANKAYADNQLAEPTPPAGWQLLTTAKNSSNGYFGTAYWHPEHQQVVIAHRGTEKKPVAPLLKDLGTDYKGVVRNKYVEQMNSASTFANKIFRVLQEIGMKKDVCFEVFFTGHSLGGWLAQITNFTTKYLYLEEDKRTFLKKQERKEHEQLASSSAQDSNYFTHRYHPHTVVFDSPGCEKMLLKMKRTFDVSSHGSSIDLQHLDITSYLSAPNRINTCNTHLGTLYHICTALCQMGCHKKNILGGISYNLATHSMDKILKALDPETGKNNDDEVEPKILEVTDWPLNKGLMRGAEYNDLFEDEKNFINYHSEVADAVPSHVPKGYYLIRLQAKDYDERTKSLSIFTQDEREFLERYCWLRQMTGFFQPEVLFSELENEEVGKEAEQMLGDFKLDNKKIHCPDASTLHGLIPYVKRLVRLFPQIKDKAKDQLSSLQLRKGVYDYETRRSVEKIDQSALDFNSSALRIRKFLGSKQQIWHLRMIDGCAWAGVTKIYRFLQNTSCTPNYSSEGHYTILDLERLQMVNRLVNLNTLLSEMDKPILLMIACGTNQTVNVELRATFKEMFNILKQKKNMKIILTTQSKIEFAAFIQEIAKETLGKGFIETDEQLTWNELTASSQKKILEKSVIFQGTSVALNQLISAESMTDSFPLADLLQEGQLKIGEELVASACSGYNEKYYIDRTFNHKNVIKQDISTDKQEGKFADLLAYTEQEFKQLCQQNRKCNVHWLEKDKSGRLVWQHSQGDLKILREYIDAHKSHLYAPRDLEKLLQHAKNQRIMIIADKAGMGKTTVLTHLSKRVKEKYPAHWLVRIDLNDYTELLETQKGKKMDKRRVLKFLSEGVLKLESDLEKELFKKSFEGNEISKVVVMVDGFDEISPRYKKTVIELLQDLKQNSVEQLWVTTRPHLRAHLEDNLQQLSYTLEPFSETEQVEFLKKFWYANLNLKDNDPDRLQNYAEALISKLTQSITDMGREFTGIPLQTRMLAEAFSVDFRSEPELPNRLNLLGLYRKFIERKYEIYYREKTKKAAGNMAEEEQRERDFENMQLEHQRLALQALFKDENLIFLKNYKSKLSDEELARIGIAERNNEGKPQFIHRTFAEFYVAEYLINELTKETEQHIQVKEILLNKILLLTLHQVLQYFLDSLLEKSKPSKETLKEYGKTISEQWNEGEYRPLKSDTTILHEAAAGDNARIIGFLLDSLKSGEHSKALKKMLFAADSRGETVCHMAAAYNSVQALKKIWEWAEAVKPTVTYSLLLSQDKDSKTAWQLAAEEGRIEVVEKLWGWAKEELPFPELLKNKLLHGINAWHLAAISLGGETLGKLWDWAKEQKLEPEELRNELLLSKEEDGLTIWHIAVGGGYVEVLDKLWDWAKEMQVKPEELRNEVLLSTDKYGQTVWHMAAGGGHVAVLEKLCVWAKELQLEPDELRNELLLSKDKYGQTAWHIAAGGGHVAVMEKLWDWAKELQLKPDELRNKLLLSKDKYEQTAWHMAEAAGHVEVLEKVWDWTKEEKINPDCFKSVLFQLAHSYRFSSSCLTVNSGHIHVLEKLWGWAEELKLTPNELKKLFLTVDKDGNNTVNLAAYTGSTDLLEKIWTLLKETQENSDELSTFVVAAWHDAAARGYLQILERLWLCAGEVQLNTQELQRKLLLDQNKDGETVWHMAAAGGHIEILDKLWVWVKEKQNSDNLKCLLFQPDYSCGFSTWCYAIRDDRICVIQKLWSWAKELQITADELKNKLFLAVDRDGNSAIYWAACTGSIELLEKLWGLCKETKLNTEELSKLLVAAWHGAAPRVYLEMLERLWLWAEEVQLSPQALQRRLLLGNNKDGESVWHLAAAAGHIEILVKLWEWAKIVQINTDDLRIAMLLAQDKHGKTAWQLAVRDGRILVFERILDWAREMQLNPGEVRNKLLLEQEEDRRTAWFLAAKSGNVKVLEELWVWTKEKGSLEELKPLLLSQNEFGQTALHLAAEVSGPVLEKLWDFAKVAQLNQDELQNKLLLAKDKFGNTAWLRAAEGNNSKALEILWNWAKEAGPNRDELRNKMFLAQNETGEAAWHLAAEGNNEIILQKLWAYATELQLKQYEIENNFLIGKDNSGNAAWHRAAKRGCLEALDTIWKWAKEVQVTPYLFLLAKDRHAKSTWEVAEKSVEREVLENQWIWGNEEKLSGKDLKKELFLFKDLYERIPWRFAAYCGSLQALQTLWLWAKKEEISIDELLLAQNDGGFTDFHMAAAANHTQILEEMWVLAEESKLIPKELQRKLLVTKSKRGDTVWHTAVMMGHLEAFEKLCFWTKETELNPEDMFLSENKIGYTVLHIAAFINYAGILQKLWDWVEECSLNPRELKKKMLLAKDKIGITAWHLAAQMGNLEAFETLFFWAKETELNPDDMLLSYTNEGRNVLHIAAEDNHVDILQKLWVCAEKCKLNPKELKKKLLLAKDKRGFTAWHIAAGRGYLEAFEKLWFWAKETELNRCDMLLAQFVKGFTVLHIAANENHLRILQKLWDCAEECKLNPKELKKKMLLAKDKEGSTAWHIAAIKGNLEAFEKLWFWAQETELNPRDMLLAQIVEGFTVLHIAAHGNHVGILQKLWDCAEENKLNPKDLKKNLFLARDEKGNNVWHIAAVTGNLEAFQALCAFAKEMELKPDDILLSQNEEGVTVLHFAAYRNSIDILQKMWVWAEESQRNPKELKRKLLLAKTKKGITAWHTAAMRGNLEVLETLSNWAKETELNQCDMLRAGIKKIPVPDIAVQGNNVDMLQKRLELFEERQENPITGDKNEHTAWFRAAELGSLQELGLIWRLAKEGELTTDELLLAQNEERNTALHIAARKNHVEMLQLLWDWAENGQVNANELRINLLLAKDNEGFTAWHHAALNSSSEALETLMGFAIEVELSADDLLLAQGENGVTAFHMAAKRNHVGILQKLWFWGEITQQNPHELKQKLFLAKDNRGFTAGQHAARNGRLDALELLLRFANEVEINSDEL